MARAYIVLIILLLLTGCSPTINSERLLGALNYSQPSNNQNYRNTFSIYNVVDVNASRVFINGTPAGTGSGSGDDTVWNITGSPYLYNNTGVLKWNETKGNSTTLAIASQFNETSKINSVNSSLTTQTGRIDNLNSTKISGAEVPTYETDSDHDNCNEISGCVVGAITDGNTGWDNSYGFITGTEANNSYALNSSLITEVNARISNGNWSSDKSGIQSNITNAAAVANAKVLNSTFNSLDSHVSNKMLNTTANNLISGRVLNATFDLLDARTSSRMINDTVNTLVSGRVLNATFDLLDARTSARAINSSVYTISQIDLRTTGINSSIDNAAAVANAKVLNSTFSALDTKVSNKMENTTVNSLVSGRVLNGTLPVDQNNYTSGFEVNGNGTVTHNWVLNRTGLAALRGTWTETSHAGLGSSNLTLSDVVAGVGNWSLDKTGVLFNISNIGNWTADKTGIQDNITNAAAVANAKALNSTVDAVDSSAQAKMMNTTANSLISGRVLNATFDLLDDRTSSRMLNDTVNSLVSGRVLNGTIPPDQNNYTTNVACDGNGTTNHICNLQINGRNNISFIITGYNSTSSSTGSGGGWINDTTNTNTTLNVNIGTGTGTTILTNYTINTSIIYLYGRDVESLISGRILNGTISFAGYGSSNVTEAYVNNKITNGTVSFAGYGSSNVTEAYVNNKLTNGTSTQNNTGANFTNVYMAGVGGGRISSNSSCPFIFYNSTGTAVWSVCDT